MTAVCTCPKCGPKRSAEGMLVGLGKNIDLTPLLNIPPVVRDLVKSDSGVAKCWMCLKCKCWFSAKEVDPGELFDASEASFMEVLFGPTLEVRRSVLLKFYSTAIIRFGPLHWSTKLFEINFLDSAFSHIRLGLPLRVLEDQDLGYEREEIMESLLPVWYWLETIGPIAPTSYAFAPSIIGYIDVAASSNKQKMHMLQKIATQMVPYGANEPHSTPTRPVGH